MTLPIVVVGGGVAGAAAATLLARQGRRVVLIEQHREPHHKVCGEFLSTEACASLRLLGIDPLDLGARPVRSVRLACGGLLAQSALPFPALSLTRRRLDETLLSIAASSGVELRLGHRVDAVTRDEKAYQGRSGEDEREPGHLYTLRLSDGSERQTRALFLANGKHDLRPWARPTARGARFVAFKQYFRLSTAMRDDLEGLVELHLFRGGYAGLQLVEDGTANLSLLIEQQHLRRIGEGWPGVLKHVCREAPRIALRLSSAEAVLPQPLALSQIPYGFLARPQAGDPWRLGDQAAVIPSFTGDGISIALHSARVAVSAYLAGETSCAAATQMRRDFSASMLRARMVARLLLTPGVRSAAVWAATISPGLMSRSALATRIPDAARRRLQGRESAWSSTVAAYNEQG